MNKNFGIRQAFGISLLFFCLAALFGFILRLAFSMDIPSWISFPNLRHAHSHVALLGWLFSAFFLAIIHSWNLNWENYRRLYWGFQFCVLGMAFAFPVMGYGPLTILLLSAHILLSYHMVRRIWKDIAPIENWGISKRLLKTSFIFLIISSLGTWSLGPIAAWAKGSILYYASIQWYLHFVFNGWLVFAMVSIIFKYIESNTQVYSMKIARYFYWSLTVATILTYALAITWSTPLSLIFYINGLGVIIQVAALILFLKLIFSIKNELVNKLNRHTYTLLMVSLLALTLKILIQLAVVIPFIARASYTIKNFVVGFIHLLLLGCLTTFLLSFSIQLLGQRIQPKATWLFIIGVLLSEFLLFFQGLLFWMEKGFIAHYYDHISAASAIMMVGIWWMTISYYLNQKLIKIDS